MKRKHYGFYLQQMFTQLFYRKEIKVDFDVDWLNEKVSFYQEFCLHHSDGKGLDGTSCFNVINDYLLVYWWEYWLYKALNIYEYLRIFRNIYHKN